MELSEKVNNLIKRLSVKYITHYDINNGVFLVRTKGRRTEAKHLAIDVDYIQQHNVTYLLKHIKDELGSAGAGY